MRRAVARGTGLTRHLLAFSRRQPVNPESIDLAAHLSGMREMLGSSLRGDIRVDMQFDPELWHVEVDAGELELAIAESLRQCARRDGRRRHDHDCRATTSGSRQTDGCTDRLREAARSGHRRRNTAARSLARVFEPFFTTKDVGKGSGLGLPQVYGFAQQSGGRVSIASEVGVGNRGDVAAPEGARAPAAPNARPDASIVPAVPRRREAARRSAAGRGRQRGRGAHARDARGLGFSVIHASNPAAALAKISDARALEAVLSDIMMPGGISGLHLAREIRRRHPTLPIVLATGYAEAAAGIRDGEFRLLLKPYSLEALADALGAERA